MYINALWTFYYKSDRGDMFWLYTLKKISVKNLFGSLVTRELTNFRQKWGFHMSKQWRK